MTARKPSGPARRYLGLPMEMVKSWQFARLSGAGLKLLMELRLQYNGYNNGDLDCTWSRLAKRGWRSPVTLNLAIKELLHCGWIEKVHTGQRLCGRHDPNLFALTWESIDTKTNKGIQGTTIPSHAWKSAPAWIRPKRKSAKPTTQTVAANYTKCSGTTTHSVVSRKTTSSKISGVPTTPPSAPTTHSVHLNNLPMGKGLKRRKAQMIKQLRGST